MSELTISTVIEAFNILITEAYAGPPDPRGTWFVDNDANAGILSLLDSINAQEASTSVDGSGKAGSTIASNAEHLRWSVANANATFRGAPYQPNWSESWLLVEADEEKWSRLRQDLRAEFEALRELVSQQTALPGEYLLGVLAMVPHAAFHLGVMRQMIERVRSR
jgi:hypothetical protein